MIFYLERNQINIEKYDECISKTYNTQIYAYSWYLDIVAESNWDTLVLGDYIAVMPLPKRRKYFINYVYTPFWVIQLGVFSIATEARTTDFLNEVFKHFRFVELRMNTKNLFKERAITKVEKQLQFLSLKDDYETIFSNYRKDKKKDLQKAKKCDLVERWNDNPEKLIDLFKNNVGKRTRNIKERDYVILLRLMNKCIEKKVGNVLSVYDKNKQLVASGFFLRHKKVVIKLVSSTDFKNRKNGANTFLIDRVIYKFQKNYETFDFGGSSIKSIADFSKSFGANTENYYLLKFNNLPRLLKLFKN